MKKRVGIRIKEDVIRRAKRRAAHEGRPLSDLIQDALVSYSNHKVPDLQRHERAYQLFCKEPIRVSKSQFKAILEEDL